MYPWVYRKALHVWWVSRNAQIMQLQIREHCQGLRFHVPLGIHWKSPLSFQPIVGNWVGRLVICDTPNIAFEEIVCMYLTTYCNWQWLGNPFIPSDPYYYYYFFDWILTFYSLVNLTLSLMAIVLESPSQRNPSNKNPGSFPLWKYWCSFYGYVVPSWIHDRFTSMVFFQPPWFLMSKMLHNQFLHLNNPNVKMTLFLLHPASLHPFLLPRLVKVLMLVTRKPRRRRRKIRSKISKG